MTFLPSGVDRSGVTAAADAVDVAVANDERRGLTFQNTSDTDMRLTETGVDATASTGYLVVAGEAVNICTNMRVSVYCAEADKTFAATEF